MQHSWRGFAAAFERSERQKPDSTLKTGGWRSIYEILAPLADAFLAGSVWTCGHVEWFCRITVLLVLHAGSPGGGR